MSKKLNLVISEETRKTCKMLSVAYAHTLTPIKKADLDALLGASKINFSVWFYSPDDEAYLEFITPLNFNKERVKKLARLSEKYPADFNIYIKASEFDALTKSINQALAKKFIDAAIYPALESVWRKNSILTNIYTEIGESDILILSQRLITGLTYNILSIMPGAREIFEDLYNNYPFFFENLVEEAFMSIVFCHGMKMSENTTKIITMAVLLKDIGIYHLPRELVEKQRQNILANKEYLSFLSHIERGVDILHLLNEKYKHKIPEEVIVVCRQHHELMNGTGQPNNLKGSQEVNGMKGMHIFSRIVSIVEHYCSLYKVYKDHQSTMKYMFLNVYKFDETLLIKFYEIMDKYVNVQVK